MENAYRKTIISYEAHKLRLGEGENSYLDVCAPHRVEVIGTRRTKTLLANLVAELIDDAQEMHGDTPGDLKIRFDIRIKGAEFDPV